MDVNEHVSLLFGKYLKKECSAEEFEEMMTWLVAMDDGEKNQLSAPMKALWEKAMANKLPSVADQVDWDRVFNRVLNEVEQAPAASIELKQPPRIGWRRVAVAVVIMGLLITGSFLLLNRKTPHEIAKQQKPLTHLPEEILSKGNQAILTLSNGSVII